IAVGRLYSGVLKKGAWVSHINRRGEIKKVQIANVMLFDGLNRIDVPEAVAGEIVAVSGIPEISIGETIAALENPKALPIIHIDEPTIKMTFGVNTSPFVGREGEYTTSRNLRERLIKELETDVALKVEETDKADRFIVSGRGELHLAILIEKMRREGYELEVSKPQVIFKENESGVTEPIETVSIEVPEEYAGVIIEMMGKRLAKMKDMNIDNHTMKMDFEIPTRGLIGVRNEFMTSTKGSGIMNTLFSGYAPYKGKLAESTHGSIITTETGITNNYGLVSAQGRGKLFMGAGVEVYEGMVIGENAKSRDELVNVCRQRELTNFRAKNDGLQDQLEVPLKLTLEDALDYIHDDELVEITPKSIRIRKRYLTENDRRKAAKEKKTEAR
ncbi:MAG TPA: EF-Tu/IF-2/RF-3 family GTPase, partial [Candidatus Colwellbacteria bacterium]|nr:EF-Tu/IF-2/RF-3 family GTPase [Candidatus Colwellbacteria bacterium]